MLKHPEMTFDRGAVSVLSVSPASEDHQTLDDLLSSCLCTIIRASTRDQASQFMHSISFALVMCERDLPPYSWKDVLQDANELRNPPCLIVTSFHADEYLWAEALNLGAYDVLAKPFDSSEVIRAIRAAHVHRQYPTDRARLRGRSAAG